MISGSWSDISYIENRAKWFGISNDIQCVTKIHNRVGCTCLAYCIDDLKQFFFDFSEKRITAALWRVVL